ncbi:hypothetical protein LTR85_011176 [Meristemomyces frigidus]|nr:hypothetical protein LTR85_011176 [Meristemomyces frigidus]
MAAAHTASSYDPSFREIIRKKARKLKTPRFSRTCQIATAVTAFLVIGLVAAGVAYTMAFSDAISKSFACAFNPTSPSCHARITGLGAELYREEPGVEGWLAQHCGWIGSEWLCSKDFGEDGDAEAVLPEGVWVEKCDGDGGEEGCV